MTRVRGLVIYVLIIIATAAVAAWMIWRARPHDLPPGALRGYNVLLVTIDTLRLDRVGAYGSRAGLTPAIDRLAREGLRFDGARSHVPLTLPSHASLLTARVPPRHGVRDNGTYRLDETQPTIATMLKAAGYHTAAFVGAFVLDRRFGLGRGFDTYDDQIARDPQTVDRLEAERPAGVVVDHALAWLNAGAANPAPFFIWIHLYDAHAPYAPPAEFRSRFAQPYDGELAYVDSQISRVIDWMRAHEGRPAVTIVAGDHGEALGDHGEATHGMLLYDATLRVPLVVSAPGLPAGVRTDPVTLADVAPTILEAARASHAVMDGHSLLEASANRTIYSETEYPRDAGWSALQSLADDRWKLVKDDLSCELFDVRSDPAETRNVAASQPSVAAAMTRSIEAIWKARTAARSPAATDEAMERVRALGYVSAGAAPARSGTADNPATHIADWNAFEQALAGVTARDPASLTTMIRLAQKYPDAPVIQTTLARATKDAGSPLAALRIYRRAAGRWPTDPTILHDLAVAARDAAQQNGSRALRDEAAAAERDRAKVAGHELRAHPPGQAVARHQRRVQSDGDELAVAEGKVPKRPAKRQHIPARPIHGVGRGADLAIRAKRDEFRAVENHAHGAIGGNRAEARVPRHAVRRGVDNVRRVAAARDKRAVAIRDLATGERIDPVIDARIPGDAVGRRHLETVAADEIPAAPERCGPEVRRAESGVDRGPARGQRRRQRQCRREERGEHDQRAAKTGEQRRHKRVAPNGETENRQAGRPAFRVRDPAHPAATPVTAIVFRAGFRRAVGRTRTFFPRPRMNMDRETLRSIGVHLFPSAVRKGTPANHAD